MAIVRAVIEQSFEDEILGQNLLGPAPSMAILRTLRKYPHTPNKARARKDYILRTRMATFRTVC